MIRYNFLDNQFPTINSISTLIYIKLFKRNKLQFYAPLREVIVLQTL